MSKEDRATLAAAQLKTPVVSLRIPRELLAQVGACATGWGRSRSWAIVELVRRGLGEVEAAASKDGMAAREEGTA
jgi:predicted transcriptional regulator